MKETYKQYDLMDPDGYKAYQELKKNPYHEILTESTSFGKSGGYYVLVIYAILDEPKVNHHIECGVDILSAATDTDAERYSEIVDECDISKTVTTFNDKGRTFMLAVHWNKKTVEHDMSVYKEIV